MLRSILNRPRGCSHIAVFLTVGWRVWRALAAGEQQRPTGASAQAARGAGSWRWAVVVGNNGVEGGSASGLW